MELIADTTYVVRVQGVRNINGLVGGGEARLRTPRPPPPPGPDSAAVRPTPPEPDSAAVPPDSAAATPPAPPARPPSGTPAGDADARAVVVPRGRE